MTPELEKAKEILCKPLCFMQWQANDVIARGEKPMDKGDIEFLLSLGGITRDEVLGYEDPCDSIKLLSVIENAKNKGLKGVMLWDEGSYVSDENEAELKKEGYVIRHTGHGSVLWQEVYFSEEDYIRAEISSFQNLFGSFASIAHMI